MKYATVVFVTIATTLLIVGCSEQSVISPELSQDKPALLEKEATSSTVDVIEIITGDVVGSSTLVRTDNGVSMTLQTTRLESGAYTIWTFVRDEGGRSLFWATGHVVGESGIGNFAAHIEEGNPPGEVLFGNPEGLTDARNALVVFIVRTHGEIIPESLVDQIMTFSGGCDENDCADVQFAVHFPPSD